MMNDKPAVQKTASPMARIVALSNTESIKQRFNEVLKDRAPSFMASVLNAVRTNEKLSSCDAMSLWSSALVAATLNLPIDSNLGFSALVPYKDKVQFQMMYKGFIQLAIRSGLYEDMDSVEVFEDELESYNPITKEIKFTPAETWKMRYEEGGKVAGYYAYFNLLTGFKKHLYMTVSEVERHAKKYSQTYKKGYGKWVEEFDAMARKTVLKLLISKYGIMSVDPVMQKAITSDQASFNGVDSEPEYDDSEAIPVEPVKETVVFKNAVKSEPAKNEFSELANEPSPFDGPAEDEFFKK